METANTRVQYDGQTVTARTRDLLHYAEALWQKRGRHSKRIRLAQGSFSTSVSASGSTHAGDGAFDVRTTGVGLARKETVSLLRALRDSGAAAAIRDERDGMDDHIHGVVIDDRQESDSAKWQVEEYKAGRNMLSNGKRDRYPYRPTPLVRYSYTAGKPLPLDARRVPLWDGVVPSRLSVQHSEQTGLPSVATFRLACRLSDLGFYHGDVLPVYEQAYPVKAVQAFQAGQGWAPPTGQYGEKTHAAIWP